MSKSRHGATAFFLFVITITTLFAQTSARRQLHRQRSEVEISPLIASGWKVPLMGAETCKDAQNCINSLPEVPPDSTIRYLAIGRGTITYSCAGRTSKQPPLYVTQQAFLYDTSSLIAKFFSEEEFHSYIPRFLDYDYTSVDNSTLTCIGKVQRLAGVTVFDIYGVDAYTVKIKEIVNSPVNSPFDMPWAHSQDDDREWDIYRVETAGGGPPYNCGDQIISDEIPVEYVAEYWFYRRSIAVEQH